MLKRPCLSIGIVVCTITIASSLAVAEVQLRFAPETRYPAGDISTPSLAIGDIDGDGRQDLAVASAEGVSVLLGNGNGSFGTPTLYPLLQEFGLHFRDVAIGDFDGDGRQDLAVNSAGSIEDPPYEEWGWVSVLLGNGDGSFGTETRYPISFAAGNITIGDFDDDGRQDLVVAGINYDGVSVLLGNGDGSFGPETIFQVGWFPWFVAVGDFDADTRQDLAVADNVWPGRVSILLGNGDGSFGAPTFYPGGSGVFVAIGDFDGDAWQDLVLPKHYSGDVSVLLGNGDGSFATPTRYPVGDVPLSVAIGDFDGDGRQDLAVANAGSWNEPGDEVSVLLGNGDGSFGPETIFQVGWFPWFVAVGDFDADTRQDLAVANARSKDISVLLNRSYVPIQVDIRSQRINPDQRGVVLVAIFGSEEFDVTNIDVATLRFGPSEAECAHDLTDPFDYNEHLEDVNLDGFMDLMTHYRVEDIGIFCGDTEATLSGQTLDGQFFEGTDTFETVGCNSNRPHRGMTNRETERIQPQRQRLSTEEQPHPGDLVEEQRVD